MDTKKIKIEIIRAGEKAVHELIKVANEKIVKLDDLSPDLAADRLKNAAASKKLAIFDAFEILSRIEAEKQLIEEDNLGNNKKLSSFAERRAK